MAQDLSAVVQSTTGQLAEVMMIAADVRNWLDEFMGRLSPTMGSNYEAIALAQAAYQHVDSVLALCEVADMKNNDAQMFASALYNQAGEMLGFMSSAASDAAQAIGTLNAMR